MKNNILYKFFSKELFRGDIALSIAVVFSLAIMLVPLPTQILDLFLSFSLVLSTLILMVSIFLNSPTDFTSFPSLLLFSTLLRLTLEIATTRLVLTHGFEGHYAAGNVVAAFGEFLMGGDVVIGAIIFSILLAVNFIVITKGSGRIAEVAARFSLDAMPGKQMAIDAELSSGAISDQIARQRRQALEEESAFFGAMDGAAKFVRGDAIAALIITGINIIGGIAIGVLRHGMQLSDALNSFTTLTIGDGLISQIPALLISAAAGIIVTKGGTEGRIDSALTAQIGKNPRPLALCSAAAAIFGLMPGLPFFPFFLLSGLFGWIAWKIRKREHSVSEEPKICASTSVVEENPNMIQMDLLRLEMGFNLLNIANNENSQLTEQIKSIRKNIMMEFGFVVPPVRIQDNLKLGANEYVFRMKDIQVGHGELMIDKLLVMNPNGALPDLVGSETRDPAFGLQARWVAAFLREEALLKGYTVVDPTNVLATHLTEIIRSNMADLLSYSATQKILDNLPSDDQRLVQDISKRELIPT
ncbi:flagellar biosynthesis protein FlhA [Kozakia baliensis NRIC 0488]|uniref:Flagellar biosynthesis protein FlhA n=2 Tax=Kozakia baliensis TaxID=153496 RepID=A0A1D8USV9_9PROT|nr:FHIPEP family type III secretion protein [Kozakia baliensis]AOX16728.1 hypothetical protein A0U89_05840 [Kozakia baliensis]GBR25711.1 flagellar biosynthesis protein FlhA [Kozakia baliensis NRIC 0488]